ncbi:TetR family transcriptional regulator [Brucella endophytica]|uniref:TetR family transcriptional regulator n=1 Tax=Brucella endophytica TaxID=1963359 RepID=A0A916WKU2_9HYPH|nr:TetR/AcrR family transcriptional regulator [Brucella endophytica]GGB11386.1 TetR family transcriptional regulator [Brucella endophytica]
MRVSREQMAENRIRILDEACRLFQSKGFDSVTVAEVMGAAGMTHGGFYGHFESKDDLIGQTLIHRLAKASGIDDADAFCAAYLSSRHRDDVAHGCPISALAGETPRQTPAAHQAMSDGIRAQIARLTEAMGDAGDATARRNAIGNWSAMVGALILARATQDRDLAEEILTETRNWIATAAPTLPGPRKKHSRFGRFDA